MTTRRREPPVREVPLLVAADLCWNFRARGGRRDLLEWLDDTFEGHRRPRRYRRAYRTLCRVLTERLGARVRDLWQFLEWTHKHRRPSLDWQAACWNLAMQRLGYDVPAKMSRDPGKGG